MISNAFPRGGTKRTLDQLARHNAYRLGDTLALVDAPDRPLWADGAPRRMTWSQVDRAVSAVAGRFFEMGLPNGSVVCVQGFNTSDTLIGILGCMRAGLVAAVMPVIFEADAVVTVAGCLGAKAILSARKLGRDQSLRVLRRLAKETGGGIRFVGAFGPNLPSGIVSFEDCLTFPKRSAVTRLANLSDPTEGLAAITFDPGPDRIFAVARSHSEWVVAASLFVEGLALSRSSRLLSTMMPMSMAGLASGMVSWLISGCRLVLHQPFDAVVLGVQMEQHDITHAVLPDVALQAALADGLLDEDTLQAVAGLTREPHRAVILPRTTCNARYFAAIGEIGVVPLAMQPDGRLRLPVLFPSGMEGREPLVEARVSQDGNLGLRGAQVPQAAVDMGAANAPFPVSSDGWVVTHYPAVPTENGLLVTGERFAAPSSAEAILGASNAPGERKPKARPGVRQDEALAGAA